MARASIAPWTEIVPGTSRSMKATNLLRLPDVDTAPITLGADDSLDGLDVLPGFHCAIGPLFV